MKICVFAYATSAVFFKEVIALSQKRGDGIEWSVIMQHAPFRDFFDDVLPQERVSYIYRGFDDRFAASTCRPQDGLFRSESNINRILATDKDGYQHESKEFQYRWAAAMIEVYREFLDRVRPEHMVFSSVETVEQSLLLNMCQDRGIAVIKNVHMRTLGYSFFSTSQYDSLPPYFGDFTERDALLARDLLDKFEAGDKNPVGFPPLERPGDRVSYFPPPLAVRILCRIWDWLRYERHQRSEGHVVRSEEHTSELQSH